jgi:hypothetical protein
MGSKILTWLTSLLRVVWRSIGWVGGSEGLPLNRGLIVCYVAAQLQLLIKLLIFLLNLKIQLLLIELQLIEVDLRVRWLLGLLLLLDHLNNRHNLIGRLIFDRLAVRMMLAILFSLLIFNGHGVYFKHVQILYLYRLWLDQLLPGRVEW